MRPDPQETVGMNSTAELAPGKRTGFSFRLAYPVRQLLAERSLEWGRGNLPDGWAGWLFSPEKRGNCELFAAGTGPDKEDPGRHR